MIKLKKLYYFFFLLIILSCFLIGGFAQFFIGLPNTIFSYAVLSLFFVFYFIYVQVKRKLFFDRVIILFHALIFVILLSAALNKTTILKTVIYLIFVLLPLGGYLFFKINAKEHYISKSYISKIFLLIALIQLPVILIQKIGFDFFIGFNRSSQTIASFDFMFGTFFLKADHALGFFLLLNIINVYINNREQQITKIPKLVLAILTLTVFIAESNISKLLLAIFIVIVVYKSFPKRVRIIGFFVVIVLIPLGYNQLKKIEAFEREVYFFKREYNSEKSFGNYQRGIAKRPQVVISYATKLPLRVIGEGPYSYFNVLSREFTNTKHFSQLIWAYADLGIVGLIIVFLLLYELTKSLGLSSGFKYAVFIIIIVYAFMTTVFSDLAIMITFMSLLHNMKQKL